MGFSSCGSGPGAPALWWRRTGLPCSAWTNLDQGSDLCLQQHWQVVVAGHQGSPGKKIFKVRFRFWIYYPSQSKGEKKYTRYVPKQLVLPIGNGHLTQQLFDWFFKKHLFLKFWNHLALVIRVCDMVSPSPGFCLADLAPGMLFFVAVVSGRYTRGC